MRRTCKPCFPTANFSIKDAGGAMRENTPNNWIHFDLIQWVRACRMPLTDEGQETVEFFETAAEISAIRSYAKTNGRRTLVPTAVLPKWKRRKSPARENIFNHNQERLTNSS